MMYNSVFVALIGVLLFGYVLERVLDTLNLKHILPTLPPELSGIYDQEEYAKSQLYKRDNTRFSYFTSTASLIVMLLMFFFGGLWLARQAGRRVHRKLHHPCAALFRTACPGR
jgi:STE24 endopeptidase